jgi:chemotaxis protein methyltransferase WspC
MTAQAAVEFLLTERIGLDIASTGPALITRAMQSRMQQCALTDPMHYAKLAERDEAELRTLIDLVVVTESWFFRDLRPFLRLQGFVRDEWKSRGQSRFRVLSIPCARGEEAYSLAIALLDAGLSPEQIAVEAVDVSDGVLEQARRGSFRANARRTEMVGDPAHYLTATDNGFEVRPEVRQLVRFRQGNLLDPALLANEPEFDAIFCRNVLIYLTSAAKETAVAKLKSLLSPGGLLFVGHAEALTILRDQFTPDPDVPSFAYRKPAHRLFKTGGAAPANASTKQAPSLSKSYPIVPLQARSLPRAPILPTTPLEALPAESPSAAKFAKAVQLADGKEYAHAAQLCKELLDADGPDARVYLLLGMIELEGGRPVEAETYLHKVAYLDNGNVEALLALASLARQRGDLEEAARRSRRADRVQRMKKA